MDCPTIEIHEGFFAPDTKDIEKQCDFLKEWYRVKQKVSLCNVDVYKRKLPKAMMGLYLNGDILISNKNRYETTFIHELNHAYQEQLSLENFIGKIQEPIQNIIGKSNSYWKRPSEVHSRIMEIRYLNNLKPTDKVTPRSFEKLDIPDEMFMDIFTKEQIIRLLNETVENKIEDNGKLYS